MVAILYVVESLMLTRKRGRSYRLRQQVADSRELSFSQSMYYQDDHIYRDFEPASGGYVVKT